MFPVTPVNPIRDLPQWLRPSPKLADFDEDVRITRAPVVFRDRFGRIWTVPKHYPTDGMSYPWILGLFLDPYDPRTIRSAVLHDFTYSMHDYFTGWFFRRRTADVNLLDGLVLERPSLARISYFGVRMFGYHEYRRKRKEKSMIDWLNSSYGPF